jgi:hypothetical protein
MLLQAEVVGSTPSRSIFVNLVNYDVELGLFYAYNHIGRRYAKNLRLNKSIDYVIFLIVLVQTSN